MSDDSKNDVHEVKVVAGKQRGEREREIVNKKLPTLGIHKCKLQVLPPLLGVTKVNVK